jgi:hypothetical protein
MHAAAAPCGGDASRTVRARARPPGKSGKASSNHLLHHLYHLLLIVHQDFLEEDLLEVCFLFHLILHLVHLDYYHHLILQVHHLN